MFIRKFAIRSKKTGESHTYHTVMQTTRQGDRVVSNTVLTLWPDFDVPQEKWKQLIFRVENILSGQGSLWPLSPDLADVAQRIADSITERRLNPPKPRQSRKFNVSYPARSWISSGPNDAHFQVAWHAMERVGFTEAFASIGLSPEKANVAKCLVAARMLRPASERSTYDWLIKGGRVLGDLAGLNFHLRSVMELYRLSDILLKHKDILIARPVLSNNSLLDAIPKRLLYDISNTYFEGNPKSELIKRGRSKEKRSDRPLLSFGLISDNKGYINVFKFFPGNVVESTTLQDVIIKSEIDNNTLVSIDRGIATEANIKWMNESGFLYLVGSRERNRTFDPDKITQRITSKTGNKIALYMDEASDPKKQLPGEIRVRCFSESQHAKDKNIISARRQGYEKGLRKLNDRCANPLKKLSHSYVMRRIGALDAKYMVSSHYKVNVTRANMGDPDGMTATGVTFEYKPVNLSKADKPGVYALRTNAKDMSPKAIVETYFQLNEIESVFKEMKSELGLRPNFHRAEERILAHVIVSVLAYQCVNWIRNKLKANGITDSWATIRDNLMDVNCVAALSKESDKAERHGTLLPEVDEVRKYFRALGLSKPIKPAKPLKYSYQRKGVTI